MNLATKTMKRLGALLLVFAMVVGMLPVQAFAQEDEQKSFKIQLHRYTKDNWNTQNPSEQINTEYRYVAEFVGDGVNVQNAADVVYKWDQNFDASSDYHSFVIQSEALKNSKTLDTNSNSAMAVQVCVDGLTLYAVVPAGTDDAHSDVATWATNSIADVTAYVGVPFEMPKSTTDTNSGCTNVLKWNDAIDKASDFETIEEGKYVLKPDTSNTSTSVTRKILAGTTDSTLSWRDTENFTIQYADPTYIVSFEIAGTTYNVTEDAKQWVDNAGGITLRVSKNVQAGETATTLKDSDYLPKVNGETATWVENANDYTTTIAWDGNAEKTINFAGKNYTFDCDGKEPTITPDKAYNKEVDGVKKSYVEFTCTTGKSGIAKIGVGSYGDVDVQSDIQKNITETENADGTKTYTVTLVLSGGKVIAEETQTQEVTVTAANGKSEEADVPFHKMLSFYISSDSIPQSYADTNGNKYVSTLTDTNSYTVNCTGLGGAQIKTVSLSGSAATVTFADGKATIGHQTANGRTLTITDNLDRKYTVEFPNLTVDNELPDASVTNPSATSTGADGTIYIKSTETVNVPVAVTETGSGIKTGTITYTTQNKNTVTDSIDEEGYTIPVEKDDTLLEWKVELEDNVGNENTVTGNTKVVVDGTAPTVTITFVDESGNQIATGVASGNGKTYLQIPNDGKEHTIIMKAEISDANLKENQTSEEIEVGRVTVAADATANLTYSFTVKDLVGNVPESIPLNVESALAKTTTNLPGLDTATGEVNGTLIVDRTAPTGNVTFTKDSNAAAETVKNNADEDVDLYDGDFTVTVNQDVSDTQGVDRVEYSLSNGFTTNSIPSTTNGTHQIAIESNGETETAEGQLIVKIYDYAGNCSKHYYNFAMDNKAPDVALTLPDPGGISADEETYYYGKAQLNGKESIEVDVTITDEFFASATLTDTSKDPNANVTITNKTYSYSIGTVTNKDQITVTATDKAGKTNTVTNGKTLIVDKAAPVITLVEIRGSEGAQNKHAKNALTYVFQVTDTYLKNVSVKYKITGKEALGEVTNNNVTLTEGKFEIQVANRQKLESYVITATDLANNVATRTLDDSESYLVDTEKPKVTVTRTGVGTTTHDGQEIYYTLDGDEKATYTIKIVDDTITLANSPTLSITVKSAVPVAVPQGIIWTLLSEADGPGVTASFSLEDGEMLESLNFKVTDAAGHNAETAVENFTVTDGRYALTKKEIVDNTAPRAEISYEQVGTTDAKLAGFEFKGEEENYVNYLKLSTDNADGEIDAESVTIKATLKLIDANLVSPGDGWTVSYTNPNVGTNSATYTKTVTVYKTIDATQNHYDIVNCDLEFSATDKAGNKLTKDTVTIEPIEQKVPKKNQTSDTVKIPLIVDFRKPTTADADAPTIEIGLNRNSTGTNGTLNLFSATNGALADNNLLMTFSAIISDRMASSILNNGTDNSSGMAQVKYALTGDSTKVNNKSDTITAQNGGMVSLSIPVELVSKNVETNDMSLSVQAFDIAGNGINKSINFGVDTMAPRVSVSYNNVPGYTVGSATYFAGTREATIQVEDLNSDLSETGTTVTTEGNKLGWNDSEKTQKVVFDGVEGGIKTYNLSVSSKDLAGNVTADENVNYGNHLAPRSFIIDKAAPVVTVTKTINDGGTFYTGTNSSVDYHNKTVTYAFTVSDDYLSNVTAGNGQVQKVNISYTIEGGNAQGTKNITLGENGGLTYNNRTNGKDEYSFTFTVKDGETLTALSMEVMDNAGNPGTVTLPFTNHVCVDTTAPKIMLTRNVDPYQSDVAVDDAKHDFYNQAVTFTVTVEDTNLADSTGFANALAATEGITVTKWTPSDGRMTAQITVANTQMLSRISSTIKDSAGNPAVLGTIIGVTGVNENENFDGKGDGVYEYDGNRVVVDTDAPTAVLTMATVNDEMVGFYTDSKGIVYIKLNNPTKDDTPDNIVTVNLNFEVTDRNLGIGNGLTAAIGSWASNGEGWTGDYLINKTTGTAVHTQKVDVKTNGKGQIKLDLKVADLAGNKLSVVDVAPINNTVPGPNFIAINEGRVTGTISLDRRQITSGNDTAAPYVELTPSAAAPSVTASGLELFNKSFTFGLKVNDGPDDGYNSGLKPVGQEGMGKISWTLTNDGNGDFVNATGSGIVHNTHDYAETININAGNGECNTFKLTVTAVDNVGNTIIYVRNFAVDTLAPRITVEFDNNDVRNDRYFRAERTATIMVEELNFDAAKTEIDSEIKNGAWGTDAQGRHVTTIDYDVDGDYTLHVSSTDLAGNHTPDGSVNYIGVACQEFTIDLTLPIIEVFYDPDIVSGVDEDGVDYYSANQHIGVRIIEHNFSENDVVDEFYINRDQPLGRGLGEFSDNGDNHNAAIVLENGNRYFFRVNYTDLAGNVADGYTSNFFSVDTVPPTIRTISELDNEQMNVVSGDLELQFVVEDAQDNLDTVHVVMTHTNNAFETVMVSGPEFLTITPQKDRSTVTVNIANIQKLKNLDGIYTIELRAYDYAGNIVTLTPPMVISLNRFGSTFTTDDPFTKQFLTPGSDGVVYHNSVNGNLIIQEINPNRVFHDETLKEEGSVLTIVVNGRSIRLEEGEDYTMTVEKRGQEGSYWYCYTYEIDKKVFEEDGELRDGRYSILIYGVDEAGNNNTNESSEYSTLQLDGEGKYTGKIEFTIDTQAPVIITTGIESNEIYNEEFRQMQIEIADATPTSIQVYLNEELVGLSVDAANLPENTLWLTQDKETGIYTLNVNEQTGIFNSQNVRIVATDAAANAAEAEVNDFHISTSFLVRMLNSIWFYLILVAVAAGVVVLVVFSRKKKAAV